MPDLSQAQIDEMLKQGKLSQAPEELTQDEKDTVGEIGNISMGNAATALSELLRRKIRITTPRVSVICVDDYTKNHPIPFVSVEIQYTKGLVGKSVLNLKMDDVLMFTDIMMGGDGEVEKGKAAGELHLSAMGELMNQLTGASATAMSQMLDKRIDISPPAPNIIDFVKGENLQTFEEKEKVVQVIFTLSIEGKSDSEIMQLMPIPFAKAMAQTLLNPYHEEEQVRPSAKPSTASVPTGPAKVYDRVEVKNIQLNEFSNESGQIKAGRGGYGILMDIPLEVSVELGRVKKNVSDILSFGKGTIIELDKLAGDTADIVINNKVIGRGEIIVIDDSYGVRITEVLDNKNL